MQHEKIMQISKQVERHHLACAQINTLCKFPGTQICYFTTLFCFSIIWKVFLKVTILGHLARLLYILQCGVKNQDSNSCRNSNKDKCVLQPQMFHLPSSPDILIYFTQILTQLLSNNCVTVATNNKWLIMSGHMTTGVPPARLSVVT